ncbi:D-glucuronyl C5-epimerase-like protein [Maribacter caenipelagi]|uniref:D-glucuronyl C5-epimerase-like protein n=1 Tax=Maribacter caenipelagi TaxID=1447781 RepID=A0A4R7DEA2_9FLAO|nr:D-glucuronyl C5-epimerase family protein [Maribacter caenipelagi]TDS18645.1 D-glucuronyl C5-epimerase-like protein [Maribacter caenipelagi]
MKNFYNYIVISGALLLLCASCGVKPDFDKPKSKHDIPIFPFTNSNIEKYDKFVFDRNHVPLLLYKDSLIYYPVQYTQVALHYYSNYSKTKSERIKNLFLQQASYIKESLVVKDEFGVWECKTLISPYDLEAPWASSMAQSFGIGVMLQAYSLTKDKSYLFAAKQALNSYEVLIKDGGIKSIWDGYVHYEEYADSTSHVLNGYIFSLGGLYYYYQLTGSKQALSLFEQGIESLSVKLKDYDAGFTSFYSLITHTGQYPYDSANGTRPDHYHELVVQQLATLYVWTGNRIFYEYAYKFYQQDLGGFHDNETPNKFKSISASKSIIASTHGPDNLLNPNWTYGNYWSTNKFPTELVIDLGARKKNIKKLVLYGLSEETLPKEFKIYIKNNNIWDLANTSQDILRTHDTKFKTRHHKTLVREYDLFGIFEGDKIKIVFTVPNSQTVALRNINIFFDQREEFKKLVNKIVSSQEDKE